MKKELLIIKTTYPKLSEAKKLAKILLTKKLASCVQFIKIESMYVWKEKNLQESKNNSSKNIVAEKEILVSIKTKANFYQKIEKEILANHPYKLPQIIAIKADEGFSGYFRWVKDSLDC